MTDYYELLQVNSQADQETIKKAYRKMALKYHPDKTGTTSTEQFQEISKAYQVLSDPKKRKIYDRYGANGIQMIEQMGEVAPFIDPDVVLVMNRIFVVGTLISALLIMFPAFISVKVDGKVGWAWVLVFIPAFIIDLFLLIATVKLPHDFSGNFMANAISLLSRFIYVGCFILFQVFIALQLDSLIQWTWFQVFIPWFIVEFFNFVLHTIGLVNAIKQGKIVAFTFDEDLENPQINIQTAKFSTFEKIRLFWTSYFAFALRVIQAILICLNPTLNLSWGLVFLPLYLIGVFKLVDLLCDYKLIHSQEQQQMVQVNIVVLLVTSFFFYCWLGLVAQRLDTGKPAMDLVFIPLFIVLSLVLCCFCCCLPLLSSSAKRMVERELRQEPTDSKRVVAQQEPSSQA